MTDGEGPAWTGPTSRLLRELLGSRPEYRRQWQERTERRVAGDVSQAGVARVIARYRRGSGEHPDSDTGLARNLKDRVRRALTGQSVTAQTLTWFTEAFQMDPRDTSALWAAFAGDRDTRAGRAPAVTAGAAPAVRPRQRTVALCERYTAGPDGRLSGRRTWHTIMALEDGLKLCPFSYDPAAERVEVRHGGTAPPAGPQDGPGAGAITFEQPLACGQTLALEYRCGYGPGGGPATEVRRPAYGQHENVDIAVTFDPARRPARVSWAVWRDLDAPEPVTEEPVPLDRGHRARRFAPLVEEAVIGFRWEW